MLVKITLIGMIFLFLPLQATVYREAFPYAKVVTAPDSLTSEIGMFLMDDELLKHTDNNFSNFRMYDTDKNEVPFVVREKKVNDTSSIPVAVTLAMKNSITLPGNRMVLQFLRKNIDPVPSKLVIETKCNNFEKSVSVYGSNNNRSWHTLASNQPIFDYSRFIDIRKTSVTFDTLRCLYYKVIINSISESIDSPFSHILIESDKGQDNKKYTSFIQQQKFFRLDNISFFGTTTKISYGESDIAGYPLTIISLHEDTLSKNSIILLSSSRAPLSTLQLSTQEVNFSRYVTIEAANDTGPAAQWQHVGSSEIYRIKVGSFSQNNLSITLHQLQRYLFYRLTIVNNNNAPITLASASGKGIVYEVLFFHRNQTEFELLYGADSFPAPHYDVTAILQKTPVLNTTPWKTGIEKYHEKAPEQKPSFDTKYILYGSLFLMVAVLAILLLKTVNKIEATTKPEDDTTLK